MMFWGVSACRASASSYGFRTSPAAFIVVDASIATPVIARPQAAAIQCGASPDTAVRLVRAVCPSTAVLDCHVGFASSQ